MERIHSHTELDEKFEEKLIVECFKFVREIKEETLSLVSISISSAKGIWKLVLYHTCAISYPLLINI